MCGVRFVAQLELGAKYMSTFDAKALSQLSHAQLVQAMLEMKAQLEAKPVRRVVFKVTDKGGISAYGLGRFPTTLYKSQWLQLMEAMPQLQEFIQANAAKLADKPPA